MDAVNFFGLERVDDEPTRWRMPVTRGLISGTGALFGGAGLGACIEIAEIVTGRPCVWATAQYLAYAMPDTTLELDVQEVVRGNQNSQVRVIAHVGDREILTVIGAFGRREQPVRGQWAQRPDVPGPADSPPRVLLDHMKGTISDRLHMRLAKARNHEDFSGVPGDGNSALWVRVDGLSTVTAAGMAIIGDFVPFGMSQALGQRAGGNSLDNTLRVVQHVETEWVLADIRIHAIENGFGHGLVHLWADDGSLLATASQSAIVRQWRDAPPSTQEVR